MKLRLVRQVRGAVRYVDQELIVLTRGPLVLRSVDGGDSWEPWSAVPAPWWSSWPAHNRWLCRLARADLRHACRLPGGDILLFGFGAIYRGYGRGGWQRLENVRGRLPLNVALLPDGTVYYGEYCDNPERKPVSVWMRDKAGHSWQAAWTFNNVRHLHGVFHDPYDNALWVTTGDRDAESALWRTRDRFRTLEKVIGGSQSWRVVQLLFTRNAILFGSDSRRKRNALYRMDRLSGQIQTAQIVHNPVFYGTCVGSTCFLGTVVEPGMVSRDRAATVWGSEDDGNTWAGMLSFQKDLLPARFFQYGQVHFPSGSGCTGHLWLTPVATNGDATSLCYSIEG